MSLPILKMLDASTGHVTKATSDLLNANSLAVWVIVHEYGWIVWAHDADTDDALPHDLATVLKLARSHGCDFVKFDCDAAVIPDLPTYEW